MSGIKRWVCLLAALALLCGVGPARAEYTTLREGDSGKAVLALKQAMYYLGYFTSLNLSGSYNAVMAERVRALQRANGLEETGIADPALQELVFSGLAIPTEGAPAPTPQPTPEPTPFGPAGTPEAPLELAPGEEYVYQDEKDGLWIYRAEGLTIEIRRWRETLNKMVWYEAEIWASEAVPLTSVISPGRRFMLPAKLARASGSVLAVTDDFYGYRVSQKTTVGVVIRGGEILADKTYRADMPRYPNLEVLALFADGSMKTFLSNAHTAREYLEMGVTDTFAFGPILVSEGQPGPHMGDDTYYHYREARCALGMIEPYHYLLLVTDGNVSKTGTRGAYLTWLGERMLARGATEAINLDGGGTTALVFMGNLLNNTGKGKRSVTSMITFGTSDQVPAE